MMNLTDQAELFKTLSVETRIRIIDLLKQRGPMGGNELADELKITPSAVSQHLKVLRYAGLVRSKRKGYWLPYEIDPAALENCREMLTNVCNCGCKSTGCGPEIENAPSRNDLSELKKHERRLKMELEKVRARIKDIDAQIK